MYRSFLHNTRSTMDASRKTLHVGLAGLCALILVSATLSSAWAGAWKGQETTKDGALHIMNPAEAMEKPGEVKMKELWRLGGETDDEDEFFGVIVRITSDSQGNIYALDSQLSEVKIYSPDGEYLNSIGREGEGPGEFRRPGDMFFLPDGNLGILQSIPGKIVQLTTAGDPAGEFPVPQPEGGGFQILRGAQLVGQNLALVRMTQEINQEQQSVKLIFGIDLINSKGELLSNMETKIAPLNFANAIVTEDMFDTFENRWTGAQDGRVFAAPDRDNYIIKVWNSDGKLDRIITREYQHYKRSAEQKEKQKQTWQSFLTRIPNADLRISDIDKDIQTIYTRDDGSLWVLSSRGARDRPAGSLGTFDVFDKTGKFVRQVTLHGQGDPREDAYFFVGDRVYVVTGFLNAAIAAQGGAAGEEEEETEEPMPMEIICYRIDEPVVAKGE
jgi:hypothetical protein